MDRCQTRINAGVETGSRCPPSSAFQLFCWLKNFPCTSSNKCHASQKSRAMFVFTQPRGNDSQRIAKTLLKEMRLFQRQPELIGAGRYAITSDVDPDVVDLFFARIMGDDTKIVTAENVEQLQQLCDELGFSGFDDEICEVLSSDWRVRKDLVGLHIHVDRHDGVIEELQHQVLVLQRQVLALQRQLRLQSKALRRVEEIEQRVEEIGRNADAAIADLKVELRDLHAEVRTPKSQVSVDVRPLSEEAKEERNMHHKDEPVMLNPEIPKISDDELRLKVNMALRNVAGLSLAIEYANKVSAVHLVRTALDNIVSMLVALETRVDKLQVAVSSSLAGSEAPKEEEEVAPMGFDLGDLFE